MKKPLTDEEVEKEIERLKTDPMVKLAMKARRIKLRRRRYMYDLQLLEKQGRQLSEAGYTFDNLDRLDPRYCEEDEE